MAPGLLTTSLAVLTMSAAFFNRKSKAGWLDELSEVRHDALAAPGGEVDHAMGDVEPLAGVDAVPEGRSAGPVEGAVGTDPDTGAAPGTDTETDPETAREAVARPAADPGPGPAAEPAVEPVAEPIGQPVDGARGAAPPMAAASIPLPSTVTRGTGPQPGPTRPRIVDALADPAASGPEPASVDAGGPAAPGATAPPVPLGPPLFIGEPGRVGPPSDVPLGRPEPHRHHPREMWHAGVLVGRAVDQFVPGPEERIDPAELVDPTAEPPAARRFPRQQAPVPPVDAPDPSTRVPEALDGSSLRVGWADLEGETETETDRAGEPAAAVARDRGRLPPPVDIFELPEQRAAELAEAGGSVDTEGTEGGGLISGPIARRNRSTLTPRRGTLFGNPRARTGQLPGEDSLTSPGTLPAASPGTTPSPGLAADEAAVTGEVDEPTAPDVVEVVDPSVPTGPEATEIESVEPRPAAKPRIRAEAKPRAKAAPKPRAKAAPKPRAKAAPEPAPEPTEPTGAVEDREPAEVAVRADGAALIEGGVLRFHVDGAPRVVHHGDRIEVEEPAGWCWIALSADAPAHVRVVMPAGSVTVGPGTTALAVAEADRSTFVIVAHGGAELHHRGGFTVLAAGSMALVPHQGALQVDVASPEEIAADPLVAHNQGLDGR